MKIKCPLCGFENEEGSKFCKNCEASLLFKLNNKNNNSKLSRKDRIYNKLKGFTQLLFTEGIDDIERCGFDASFIGEKVGVSRNNASKELNRLSREGKALKIKGKPVFYLDKSIVEVYMTTNITTTGVEERDAFIKMIRENQRDKGIPQGSPQLRPFKSDLLLTATGDTREFGPRKSIFDRIIIGAEDSLKFEVEQAKAAILYPPNGLHVLIVGSTGVGKTTFAEAMYRYAIETGKVLTNSSFIVFNCANYATNPQLLMSQLFGYVKGAFTGADKEKKGLVDLADGGILFLDEVHRLPPEGQEMMFLLMDKGIYRRLGEVNNTRKARVLIIAATTEEPQSVMLHTFLRRIPVIIRLPELNERILKERAVFIYRFFSEESAIIKLPVRVSKEVLKAFMFYECPGNIGQLKSDIKLICANAFLDYITYKKSIVEVRLSCLSQKVRGGSFKIGKNKEDTVKGFNLGNKEDVIFDEQNTDIENLKEMIHVDENMAHDELYDFIQKSWIKFSDEGLSQGKIREKIDTQIQDYFERSFFRIKLKNQGVNRNTLSKVVRPVILETVEEALTDAEDLLSRPLTQKLTYDIAFHVQTVMERVKIGTAMFHLDKEDIAKNYPQEYYAAKTIKAKIEKRLSVSMLEDEVAFLAMFLYAARTDKVTSNIGILVIAHGEAAASTMANVANSILGVEHVHAIDMLLDEKVEVVLNKSIEEVRKIDMGKGVLLLVDMGPLTTFSQVITERTSISTRSIEMVNTPMVIEATREAMMPDMDLDRLTQDAINMTPYTCRKQDLGEATSVSDYKVKFFQEILVDILNKTLTFLNSEKAYEALAGVLEKIVLEFNETTDDDILIKFLFHCPCMIERVIRNQPLPYKNLKNQKKTCNKVFKVVKHHFETIEEIFGINIPDTELAYIVEMFNTHFGINS